MNDQYEAYGFLFEQYDGHDTYGRFTEGQIEVLGMEYRWTFVHDTPATESRQVWIDGWVYDLVAPPSKGSGRTDMPE